MKRQNTSSSNKQSNDPNLIVSNKRRKTNIPAQYRRLDSLARLLELNMTCAAVYYDIVEKTIYITTNSLNPLKNKQKRKAYSFEETEAFNQLKIITQHFKSNDFLAGRLVKPAPKDSLELLYTIYKARESVRLKGYQFLADLDKETAKTIIKKMLETNELVKPIYLKLAYFEQFLAQSGQQKKQTSSSNNLNFYEQRRYPTAIEIKLSQIKKFYEQVWGIVRDYRKFRAAVANPNRPINFNNNQQPLTSKKVTLDIEHYKLLLIGDPDAHAEIKMATFLLNQPIPHTPNNPFYIGISKLCCPHCYNVISHTRGSFTFLYEDEESQTLYSSQDEQQTQAALKKASVRGQHDFWKKEWVVPAFMQHKLEPLLTKCEVYLTWLKGNQKIKTLSKEQVDGQQHLKISCETKINKTIKVNVFDKIIKSDNEVVLLFVKRGVDVINQPQNEKKKKKKPQFSCYIALLKKDVNILYTFDIATKTGLYNLLSKITFPKKQVNNNNQANVGPNIKLWKASSDKEKYDLLTDSLLASKLFRKKENIYQLSDCYHSVWNLNIGKREYKIKDFASLEEKLNKLEETNYTLLMLTKYCEIVRKEKVTYHPGNLQSQYPPPSTSEGETPPGSLLSAEDNTEPKEQKSKLTIKNIANIAGEELKKQGNKKPPLHNYPLINSDDQDEDSTSSPASNFN